MKKADVKDYNYYKEVQVHRSDKKWNSSTFFKNLQGFLDLIQEFNKISTVKPKNVVCMGIRNGNEYLAFKDIKEFKDVEIYGVDINPLVNKVGDNCFCYDFSKLPKEWENKFDIVYSNSLDHSYNVEEAIKEWYRVCKGYLILTLSFNCEVDNSDIYSFEIEDIPKLFDYKLFKLEKTIMNDTVFSLILSVKK